MQQALINVLNVLHTSKDAKSGVLPTHVLSISTFTDQCNLFTSPTIY
jgi:hypothetical protein